MPISPADYEKTLPGLSDKQLDVEISYFDRWLLNHPYTSPLRDKYDAKRRLALRERENRRYSAQVQTNYAKQLRTISLEELEDEKVFFTRQLTLGNARVREIAQHRLTAIDAEFARRGWVKGGITRISTNKAVPVFSLRTAPLIGPRLRYYLDNYAGAERHEVAFGWEALVELREELKAHPALKLRFRSVDGFVLVRIDVDLKEHLKG